MGQLYYLVNHDRKEWINPCNSKIGEILRNKFILSGLMDLIHCCWNNCRIEFIGDLSNKWSHILKEYKEIQIDWDYYHTDSRDDDTKEE